MLITILLLGLPHLHPMDLECYHLIWAAISSGVPGLVISAGVLVASVSVTGTISPGLQDVPHPLGLQYIVGIVRSFGSPPAVARDSVNERLVWTS